MELTGQTEPAKEKEMKKSLLAIVLAAATLPLTFAAQSATPANQNQAASAQKSTAKKTKKPVKHHVKKTKTSKTTTPAPTPAQK